MPPPRTRLLDLLKTQSTIFSHSYNPDALRTGSKVLRQRLRGPSMAAYYPRRVVTFRGLMDLYPGLESWDDEEEDRLEHLDRLNARGKGAPKKRRTKEGELIVFAVGECY
ncbi:MAG: hypothetical protein Q9195_003335 [Heterodermia aff. obscurata]